ncbi:MAG: OmpA family protein [Deltaproteobacteria bacterium]|nr:OmpA family protein [Deltaproteobacteria bacterium]
MAGRPKPAFFILVGLVVLGLVAFALYRMGILAPKGTEAGSGSGAISKEDLEKIKKGGGTGTGVEAPDQSAPTTTKEYKFVPEAKLPPVKGVSSYEKLKDNTVRFALNVWAGWAPIIWANGGLKAGKVWKGPKDTEFKVELVLIDDPVKMRDAYAAGKLHVGWSTVDMIPLFLEELRKDSRIMPRVYQQIDWSNGGDGIVARGVQNVNELRGKSIALALNSPSEFFLLNALINAGVQPGEVTFKGTGDAFQAAAAFNSDKSIAACVSWAPDIYNLAKAKGNKLIVSTATANKLIADVWFARADFAKDHPEIIEGLVRTVFDAMEEVKQPANKQKVAALLAKAYSIPATDAMNMLADAHNTNYAENREFFMNQNNPTNFERTWETAYYLYKRRGKVTDQTAFDQVMDFSVLKKLGAIPKYANQKNEYDVKFTPKSVTSIKAESGEILTKTVVIHFFPNSFDLDKKVARQIGDKTAEELYDPNVPLVLEEIGKLAGQYGAARIVIEGHTDASMKGHVPFDGVRQLSEHRANAVKEALLKKFKTLQPNQFAAEGAGWNRPADPNDPANHAKNRRVEVKVFPMEAQ